MIDLSFFFDTVYPSPLKLNDLSPFAFEAAWVFAALAQANHRVDIPVAFEAAWVLATLLQPNHRVDLCSGASLACRLHASSSVLGIDTF